MSGKNAHDYDKIREEIVEALEGPISLVECLSGVNGCPRSGACATQDIWCEVNTAMGSVLEKTTLAGLVERQMQKTSSPAVSYDI